MLLLHWRISLLPAFIMLSFVHTCRSARMEHSIASEIQALESALRPAKAFTASAFSPCLSREDRRDNREHCLKCCCVFDNAQTSNEKTPSELKRMGLGLAMGSPHIYFGVTVNSDGSSAWSSKASVRIPKGMKVPVTGNPMGNREWYKIDRTRAGNLPRNGWIAVWSSARDKNNTKGYSRFRATEYNWQILGKSQCIAPFIGQGELVPRATCNDGYTTTWYHNGGSQNLPQVCRWLTGLQVPARGFKSLERPIPQRVQRRYNKKHWQWETSWSALLKSLDSFSGLLDRRCPELYPICHFSGTCVIQTCASGCSKWEAAASVDSIIASENFILGTDNLGTRCSGDYVPHL